MDSSIYDVGLPGGKCSRCLSNKTEGSLELYFIEELWQLTLGESIG